MADHPDANGNPGASWDRAMRSGDLAAAWAISDAVLAARDHAGRDNPALPYHRRWVWSGAAPDGTDVLVRCYHGLGDTLQFARFLPALRARAAHVTLEAPPALVGLLSQVAGVDRIVGFDPARPLPQSSCDIEIMELGHVLRVGSGMVGADVPYLAAAPLCLGATLGLCWRAGDWDGSRSVGLAELLRTVCGAPYVSLQRGQAAEEATGALFVNPADTDVDVGRTASLIVGAGRVVSVDTMVAHLAGALGVRGVVLLKQEADWRWAERAGRSLWYPSLRLVRRGTGSLEV